MLFRYHSTVIWFQSFSESCIVCIDISWCKKNQDNFYGEHEVIHWNLIWFLWVSHSFFSTTKVSNLRAARSTWCDKLRFVSCHLVILSNLFFYLGPVLRCCSVCLLTGKYVSVLFRFLRFGGIHFVLIVNFWKFSVFHALIISSSVVVCDTTGGALEDLGSPIQG